MKRGFTLLEIMIAMAILMLIVLMMGNLFHHSTYAWNTAIRKTELTMEGRSALNFMVYELGAAVADPVLSNGMFSSGANVSFYTRGTPDSTNREVRHVTYYQSGDTVMRHVDFLTEGAGYPVFAASPMTDAILVTNVDSFAFTVTGGPYRATMPEWLDIKLVLKKSAEYRVFGVRSSGPDQVSGNGDDIKSWVYQP